MKTKKTLAGGKSENQLSLSGFYLFLKSFSKIL